MKLVLRFIFFTTVFTTTAQASMTHLESFAKCLPKVESGLGKPATSKAAVFELNATHAMEFEFDKDCQIVKVQISPKYVWEEKIPEWVEPSSAPGLSMSEYEDALAKINELRAMGSLLHKGDARMSIVTNSKQYTKDNYEHALIERVMNCCDNKSVFSVDIYFR